MLDDRRLTAAHHRAWRSLWPLALVVALGWTLLAVVVDHLGSLSPLGALAATVLAGLAVGVRLPAASPGRARA